MPKRKKTVTDLQNVETVADDSQNPLASAPAEPAIVSVENSLEKKNRKNNKNYKIHTSVTTDPAQTSFVDSPAVAPEVLETSEMPVNLGTDVHTSVTTEPQLLADDNDKDSNDNQVLLPHLHSALNWSRPSPASRVPYQRASFGEARLLEQFVSLTVKVPDSWREHWQVEVRKRRTSLSALVVQMLVETLGLPQNDE